MALIPLIAASGILGLGSISLLNNDRRQQLRTRCSTLGEALSDTMTKNDNGLTISNIKNAVQRFKAERIDPYLQDSHSQSKKDISVRKAELSMEEKFANQFLKNSSILVGSTVLSALIYTPLLYLHLPFLIYVSWPMYKQGFNDLVEKRRVTFVVVDTIWSLLSVPYTIVYPHFLIIGAIAGWLFSIMNRMIVRTKDHTRQELTNLFGQQPLYVWVLKDDVEVEVLFNSIAVGDIIAANAGEMIPVDGVIYDGIGSIDQRMLTGESQPVEKESGELVFAGTMILSGKIYIRVEKTGDETTAAQIGEMLIQTSNYTSDLQLRGEEISDRAAVPTLGLGALSLLMFGPNQALAVLYAGIGRNMRIFGPLSVLNYLQLTARQGILIKDGRALEQVSKVDTIVFDKTGTLTLDQPHVGTIHSCNGYLETAILTIAAAAENRQTHPIARAIREAAQERDLELPLIGETNVEMGYGIKVTLDQELVQVGSSRFMTMEGIAIPEEIENIAQDAHGQGHSLVYVAIDGQLGGAIELVPTIRPEAKQMVQSLQEAGLETYIISGDHERPTRALAEELGIQHYFAETLPENKADHIARLQDEGKFVCFVGDGINDAIALKKAQVSVSLSGASTIATDTAQVILMDRTLNQLGQLFTVADEYEKNMQYNLFATVAPGVVIIGGAFTGLIGFGGAIPIFFTGLGLGVLNAMRPLFALSSDRESEN